MNAFIPVKKFTYEISNTDDIDLSNTERWGDLIGGGMLSNVGTQDVIIDDTYTLSPGQTMTIGIQYPYIDRSIYRVKFPYDRSSGQNRLAITLYRIFPNAAIKHSN